MTANIPVIELYVRASHLDKVNISAVPTDQQYFMAFHLLHQRQRLVLKEVVTINSDVPPLDYLEMNVGNKLPVVKVLSGESLRGEYLEGLVLSHSDEIDQFLDSFAFPGMRTARASGEEAAAEKVFLNLQTKLNLFLKDPSDDISGLVHVLARIEDFLCEQGTTFLLDDQLGFADCLFLPRLHHVRIAAMAYKGVSLPLDKFPFVRAYVKAAYLCEVFTDSCPADEDIIAHYAGRTSRQTARDPRIRHSRTFSTTIN